MESEAKHAFFSPLRRLILPTQESERREEIYTFFVPSSPSIHGIVSLFCVDIYIR
jgi:hypothetical protein